jgi:cell division protein FtsL
MAMVKRTNEEWRALVAEQQASGKKSSARQSP